MRRRRATDPMDRTVPGWMDALLVGGTFGVLLWLERRHPLRKHAVEPKLRRGARNLAVAALAAAAVQVAEKPVTAPLTRLVGRRRWGLLQRLPLPAWLEVVLAAVLLDYTLYLWHVLTHRVPLLWRFHQVHHADLDMDASTAVRFHFGEMTLSVAWRAMQVRVIGVRPLALSVWNTLLLPCVMFHHSNAGLPLRLERRLSKVLVTPRMHAIHHSIVPEETNANWSSGLTAWDRLHRTLRLDVAQDDLTLGVPAYRRPGDVTLPKVLAMPFTGQPPGERLPDGTRPRRGRAAAPRLRG